MSPLRGHLQAPALSAVSAATDISILLCVSHRRDPSVVSFLCTWTMLTTSFYARIMFENTALLHEVIINISLLLLRPSRKRSLKNVCYIFYDSLSETDVILTSITLDNTFSTNTPTHSRRRSMHGENLILAPAYDWMEVNVRRWWHWVFDSHTLIPLHTYVCWLWNNGRKVYS